jgi:hypothetical protein
MIRDRTKKLLSGIENHESPTDLFRTKSKEVGFVPLEDSEKGKTAVKKSRRVGLFKGAKRWRECCDDTKTNKHFKEAVTKNDLKSKKRKRRRGRRKGKNKKKNK